MIKQFLTIKKSLVSFLSKRPENASRGCSPSLTTPFLYKSPFHPRRVSLTMSEITHRTPKMENASCYSNLALSQWRRIWSMVSNSTWHKAHMLAKVHPLFWSWSKVNLSSTSLSSEETHLWRNPRVPHNVIKGDRLGCLGHQARQGR